MPIQPIKLFLTYADQQQKVFELSDCSKDNIGSSSMSLSKHHSGRNTMFCLYTYKQRYLMPEGINARVSRYYICWHSIAIVCYTFVQQLEICN